MIKFFKKSSRKEYILQVDELIFLYDSWFEKVDRMSYGSFHSKMMTEKWREIKEEESFKVRRFFIEKVLE